MACYPGIALKITRIEQVVTESTKYCVGTEKKISMQMSSIEAKHQGYSSGLAACLATEMEMEL